MDSVDIAHQLWRIRTDDIIKAEEMKRVESLCVLQPRRSFGNILCSTSFVLRRFINESVALIVQGFLCLFVDRPNYFRRGRSALPVPAKS